MLIDNLWEERDWGISSVCREFVSLCVHIGFCLVLWKVFPGNEPVQSWPLVLYLSEDSIDWNSDFFFFFSLMKRGFSPKICVVHDNCFLTSYFGNSWAVISLGNMKCISHWSSLLDSDTKLPLKCTWKAFRGIPHTHKSWAKLNEGITGLLHVLTISQHFAEQGTKEMRCGRSQGIQEKWWLALWKI